MGAGCGAGCSPVLPGTGNEAGNLLPSLTDAISTISFPWGATVTGREGDSLLSIAGITEQLELQDEEGKVLLKMFLRIGWPMG